MSASRIQRSPELNPLSPSLPSVAHLTRRDELKSEAECSSKGGHCNRLSRNLSISRLSSHLLKLITFVTNTLTCHYPSTLILPSVYS